jgi:hypothetical protein
MARSLGTDYIEMSHDDPTTAGPAQESVFLDDRVNALDQFKPEITAKPVEQETLEAPTSAMPAVAGAPTDSVAPARPGGPGGTGGTGGNDEPLLFAKLSAESVDLERPELLDPSVKRTGSLRGALLCLGVVFVFVSWYLLRAGGLMHQPPAATTESVASSPAAAQTERPAEPEPTQIPAEPVLPSAEAPVNSTPRSRPSGVRVAVDDQQPRATAGTSGGTLSVDSHPAGANVFIDGQLAGKTPMSLQQILPGTHEVRLELDGHRGWSSSVRVVREGRNRVTASLEEETR